jgi:hypothetical protein
MKGEKMKNLKNNIVLEDTRREIESITKQTRAYAEEIRSYSYLINLIFDAIR